MLELKQYRDPMLMTNHGKSLEEVDVVGFYEREFYPFSNFSSFQVDWREHTWMTSEHAYHSEKFAEIEPELYEALKSLKSAHEAFIFARDNKARQRTDWDDIKRPTMKNICRAKLAQHAYVQHKLLDTNNLTLVEDSPVDSFWGWGPDRQGRNELGKIWMELREELQHGEIV